MASLVAKTLCLALPVSCCCWGRSFVQLVPIKHLQPFLRPKWLRPQKLPVFHNLGHIKITTWENSIILMFPTIPGPFHGNSAMFVQFRPAHDSRYGKPPAGVTYKGRAKSLNDNSRTPQNLTLTHGQLCFQTCFQSNTVKEYDILTIIDPVWSLLRRGTTRVKNAILFAFYLRKSASAWPKTCGFGCALMRRIVLSYRPA